MANFNFNKVILGGRVASDVELRTTPSGVSVTSFTLAVNRRTTKNGEQQTDFFYVTAWRQTAEFFTRYFRKGLSVCVEGEIQIHNWTGEDGVKRFGVQIVADSVHFVESKGESDAAHFPAPAAAMPSAEYMATQGARVQFEQLGDDEELPF